MKCELKKYRDEATESEVEAKIDEFNEVFDVSPECETMEIERAAEGPQIPDPGNPFWKHQVEFFLNLWEQILTYRQSVETEIFTITPEFGPPPYMWTNIIDNSPIANQWDINLFMKNLLLEKFSHFKK